ncbi:hypothetical protein [Aquabacterium sp. OR-4]|uniref:hypothetical protein n=1 Tax=Aquabacterium sp. OR-4 TaxID=2978127 RepID=UPI0021B22052|nr:hypothetical protein [Aquabacterium sp. OR-4]MDT7834351.1 hypothetical protein [Aquabacterium sp. OR-4]
MNTRTVTIHTGVRIRVPEHIQRIDTHSTHGWQMRYGQPTLFFSDGQGSGNGPRQALKRAVDALRQRIAELPAPTGLQREISPNKQNDLPVGISGPILRHRPGRSVPECHFSVNLPRFGAKPLRRSVYIANQNTYSPERYQAALDSAIQMRREAESQYQVDATEAKRKSANKL